MNTPLKQLGFLPVLRMGIKRSLQTQDYNISSFERVDAAFCQGVLAAKELVARERAKEIYPRSIIPDLVRRAFPVAKSRIHPDTGTIYIPLSWHIEEPLSYHADQTDTAAELHVFLDNSGDSLKQLVGITARLNSRLVYQHYTGLVLLGEKDKRACSAIFFSHGPQGAAILEQYAQLLEQETDPLRVGYSIDCLYPRQRPLRVTHGFERGQFRLRRQRIFTELWSFLYMNDILFMSQLLECYDHLAKQIASKLDEKELANSALAELRGA